MELVVEKFTGAVAVISAETLEMQPSATFQSALQGAAPGLQVVSNDGAPGAGISIRVRGIGSISSSNEPLYVIDGMPITSDLFLQLISLKEEEVQTF